MDEYIEREHVLRKFNVDDMMNVNGTLILLNDARNVIEKQPAADVAPVVHGRWIADGDGYHWTYNCSICAWKDGYPFNERHNFCPNCGAKMDGEAERRNT